MFNFLIRPVTEYDVSPFLAIIESFTEKDWQEDKTRSGRVHFAYKTNSMRIGLTDRIDAAFVELNRLTTEILNPVFGNDWEIGRFVLSRCPPGGGIKLHRDQTAKPEIMRRFHIPITTNPGAVTIFPYSSKERLFMPVGQVQEFNYKEPHKTENTGETNRVHLVFDFFQQV